MEIRVRAIIIQDRKVLLIHRTKEGEEYWVFPGGGVEESDHGPTSAIIRECREELGVEVKINHLFTSNAIELQGKERKELFFICDVAGGVLGTGTGPEYQSGGTYRGTYRLEWVEMTRLPHLDVRPDDVKQKLFKGVE